MLKGFRDFLFRGNIVELAVAVVIGTAFTGLVTTFTKAFIEPILARLGGVQTPGLVIWLGAKGDLKTGIDVGVMLNAFITFFITAAVVYFIFVLPMNKMSERRKRAMQPVAAAPTDNELLLEIRDLLRAQTAQGEPEARGTRQSAAMVGRPLPEDPVVG
jgi:large conductance mechanosensitive channel